VEVNRNLVQALKDRYDPSDYDVLKGLSVLSLLHHMNIKHLRGKLLRQYAFLRVKSKPYLDGMRYLESFL
jgi:hypothetical protein